MKHRSIITLAGKPGSGKSTAGNAIAKQLGWKYFSSGDFMRAIAKERKLTLKELGSLAEKDSAIDQEVDERVQNAGKKGNIVLDSRLAFHWIPDSFKVYLDTDSKIAAERIFANMTENRKESGEGTHTTPEELARSIDERRRSEDKRYKEHYGVTPGNFDNYDLILDTGKLSHEEVVEKILKAYRK